MSSDLANIFNIARYLKLTQTLVLSTIGSVALYIFRDDLKDLLVKLVKFFFFRLTCIFRFKKFGNEKILYSIMQHLEKKYLSNSRELIGRQGNNEIIFSLPNGTYNLIISGWLAFVHIADDEISIWSLFRKNKYLENVLKQIYVPDNIDDAMFFYISSSDNWNVPFIRRHRPNIPTSNKMKELLEDVSQFVTEEKIFVESGKPYRKGYFIEGKSGTGKL